MKSIYFLFSLVIFSCSNAQPADTHIKQPVNEQAIKNVGNNDEKKIAQKTINLKSYGAKGLGVSSIKEDTTALRNAIADLNKNGGGKLYIPNPPKFYAFAGDGVFVGDNIEIYGDGKGKSEIRNVSPMAGNFMKGPIFLFSTYGAVDKVGIFQDGVDQYNIKDAQKNDMFVVLKNSAQGANLNVDEVVILAAGKFVHASTDTKGRFHYMELNEISSIKDGKVSFKYPIGISLTTDSPDDAPVIVNINNTASKNFKLGIKNGTSKNIYIHDLTLSQAQTDELNNNAALPSSDNGLSGVWQPGGAFGSRFENIKVSSYGALEGNMFTRCNFNNIDIQACKTFFDFGYGSSNDTVHDIKWQFMNSPASTFTTAFIICNDGTHSILMYNIDASGAWNGEALIAMAQAKNITIHDMNVDFPNYKQPKILIGIADKDGAYSRDVSLYNFKINIASVGTFLRIAGDDDIQEPDRNINVNNITFNGNIMGGNNDNGQASLKKAGPNAKNGGKKENGKGQAVFVQNINGLSLSNINISSGGLYIDNCSNSTIQKIVAPSSRMTVTNSKNGIKFNQISVQDKVVN